MTIRTKDYKKFSAKINKAARKKRFPLHAMFELTYRCNFRCIHCYITDEQKKSKLKDELKTKDIFTILEQLKDLGTFYLGFTGGEIFCRKDILDILWYAKKLGFEVILLTNGSFINKRIADELRRLKPNKVDISVHAMDEDIFDEITRIPGSYEKVFRAIRLLHERKVPIGIKTCGMQENKNEVVKVSKFARKLNAIYRFDGELQPRLDRSKVPFKHSISAEEAYSLRRACYPEMFARYDEKGRLRKRTKSKKRNLKRLFNCGAGYTDLTISPYGELKTCIDIDYPKYRVLEGSVKDGWQVIKDLVDNLKPPKDWACRSCHLIEYCSWCPARAYLNDGNFSSCDSYSRREAEFLRKITTSKSATKRVA